jgi:hypothetical protein
MEKQLQFKTVDNKQTNLQHRQRTLRFWEQEFDSIRSDCVPRPFLREDTKRESSAGLQHNTARQAQEAFLKKRASIQRKHCAAAILS